MPFYPRIFRMWRRDRNTYFWQLRVRKIPYRIVIFNAVYGTFQHNHEYAKFNRARKQNVDLLCYKRYFYANLYLVFTKIFRHLRTSYRLYLYLRLNHRTKLTPFKKKLRPKTALLKVRAFINRTRYSVDCSRRNA